MFFQAEDGIRDGLVTGVQTCALPILTTSQTVYVYVSTSTSPNCTNNVSFDLTIVPLPKIGRASCRERV